MIGSRTSWEVAEGSTVVAGTGVDAGLEPGTLSSATLSAAYRASAAPHPGMTWATDTRISTTAAVAGGSGGSP